ncbi:Beta-glucuronidase [Blattella germanica]|nr:Beta-glucuronidase [Blattella germanica]
MNFWLCILAVTITVSKPALSIGILYPQESESREVKRLDGIWTFCLPNELENDLGDNLPDELENYLSDNLLFSVPFLQCTLMPVPSSYNDVTVNATIRDFVGWAFYVRTFFVPKRWKLDNQRVVLRFGSVHYTAKVMVNNNDFPNHYGGHLPFEMDITESLIYGSGNLILVVVNNTLNHTTIPQGHNIHTNDTNRYPPGYIIHNHDFDFFNYAGIHRPVYIYTTPQVYIDDITVVTDVIGDVGKYHCVIKYELEYRNKHAVLSSEPTCTVIVYDERGDKVATHTGLKGKVQIPKAKLWWPYLMNSNPGFRYQMEFHLNFGSGEDIYRLPVGIRKISWNSTSFLINNVPVYMRGFGKHEDSNIRGKGLDYPLLIRDYDLIKWLGANAYRTSHYPYAEEIMEVADQSGIMIIDESPACTIDYFTDELLETHKNVMIDFVRRDKNRPSVIMWSLSNEPRTFKNESSKYFSTLANLTRQLDPTRPVTFVTSQSVSNDKAVEFMDVVCVNRYPAWYSDSGHTELIQLQVINELSQWHHKFNKPVLVTEYGAGSVVGMHTVGPPLILPSSMWTEDYQVATLLEHFKAFDKLQKQGFLIGEMIWNFADFATPQGD